MVRVAMVRPPSLLCSRSTLGKCRVLPPRCVSVVPLFQSIPTNRSPVAGSTAMPVSPCSPVPEIGPWGL
jgi:hypothetical protein